MSIKLFCVGKDCGEKIDKDFENHPEEATARYNNRGNWCEKCIAKINRRAHKNEHLIPEKYTYSPLKELQESDFIIKTTDITDIYG